jgi:hypothetical protein
MKSLCVFMIGALSLLLVACGGGSDTPVPVIEENRTLSEGAQLSYPRLVGEYRAEITSSRNGIAIVWLGGSGCQSATEVRSYSASCLIPSIGTLTIVNPTLLGAPGDEVVNVRVFRR